MKLRTWILALLVAVAGGLAVAPAVQAAPFDRYRAERYYRGRDGAEIRRRDILRARLFDVADRVRLAERDRLISRRQADEYFERLDDVRDFLRGDRYLTDSEFRRRMNDLDDIVDDLRDDIRDRRWDRYDRYYRGRYRR